MPSEQPPPTFSFALFRGDTVKATGTIHRAEARMNAGDFAFDELLLDRGTQAIAVVSSAERLSRLNPSRSFLDALVASLQGALFGRIHAYLTKPLDDLLVSVIYGDKVVQLSDDIQNAFRRAGMMHILVVSGTQVSFLIIFLSLFFIRITYDLSRRGVVLKVVQFATIVFVVFVFALITGFEISVVRAFIMGVLILFARVVNRDADGMNCLAQAGLIMLVLRPADLFTASFQLSFAATFGLIYTFGCVHPLVPRMHPVPRYAVATLISTGGAQVFLTPFLAQTFDQFTLWGLPSNLVAIPVSFWILAVGTLFNVVSFTGVAFVVAPLAFILTWLLKFLLWWATFFAELPGSNMPVATMPTLEIAGYFAVVFILGETLRIWRSIDGERRFALLSATAALVLALIVYPFAREIDPTARMRVLALPAGQAVAIRKSGATSLVLTPPSFPLRLKRFVRSIDSNLRAEGVRRIDRVYFTDDWHRDEVAVALAANYRIGVIHDATGAYALKASPGGDAQVCPIIGDVPDAPVPIEAVKALHWGGHGITSYVTMLGDSRVLVLEDFRDKFFPDERLRLPEADYIVTSARNLRLITLPRERVIDAARDATLIVDAGRLPDLPDSAWSARESGKLIATDEVGEVVLAAGKRGGVKVRTYLRGRN
jgi:ComEC/Rec2-related protein